VRVCIKGKTAAHGELFGLESQLREEILGQAAGLGIDRLWVEKVRIETEALAKLSEMTQVIFLSHHAHLVPLAQSVFGDRLNVVSLG
jgi:hypothetical protein